MSQPTIHVLAPFHTILNDDYSHCAFTGKARRFAKMLKPHGYQIIEYSNKGSLSDADVKVVMLNESDYKGLFRPETNSPGAQANTDTPGYRLFHSRLEAALRERVQVGDIIAHIRTAHQQLVGMFPGAVHVETGIGYPQPAFGAYRVFESYAWQHYHLGRIGSPGGVLPDRIDTKIARLWVVPNYFDVDEWPFADPVGRDVVFMSRFVVDKGIHILTQVIKEWQRRHPDSDTRFVLAGMGDYTKWFTEADFTAEELARIDYRGVVNGRARAALVGSARAFLLPSTFVEPFGGAAVEAMLTGTPVIVPPIGAFTETVVPGVTGFHCRTVEDYVGAIELAHTLNREEISQIARARFSLETCGKLYDQIFRTLVTRASV